MHSNSRNGLSEATYLKGDQRKANEKRQARKIQRIVSSAVVLLCFAFLVIGGINFVSSQTSAYTIFVNGEEIATLASHKEAEAAVDQFLAAKSAETNFSLSYKDNLEIKQSAATGVVFSSTKDAADALEGNIHMLAQAVALCINGQAMDIYVSDKETAVNAIELIRKQYGEGEDIISVVVEEEISVEPALVECDEVLDAIGVRNMLIYGVPELSYHFVEDATDTYASLAENYHLNIEELKSANPTIGEAGITVGSAICLTSPQPVVQIRVTREVKREEQIPFGQTINTNSTLARGTTQTVSDGEPGVELVTYADTEINGVVVASERQSAITLIEPKDQVIERGTKVVLSNRSIVSGSGLVGWPYDGLITSRFGMRSRGWHSGLDIAGPTGDTIVAAEAGKVTMVEWYYGYGKCIIIDHGGGMTTLYGHLHDYAVSVGDTVTRGQKIGYLGNTGNSTGPHVHFEVRFNGVQENPELYLGPR